MQPDLEPQPSSERSGAEWPDLPAWAAPIAIALYAVAALGFWAEDGWRPEWDSAIYLLTAKALEAGEGYRYLGQPFFLRPPGLSWLLSFAAGPAGFDFAQLNRFAMGFAVAAVAGIYFALVPSLGRARALGVALLSGTSALFVARFNFVLSDLPFLALLFPALGLFDRAASGGRGAARAALVGVLLLAGAAYLRTAALAALPGVVLLYAWRRRGRERLFGWVPAIAVCAAVAPWALHAGRAANEATRPSEQLLLFDYTTALLHLDPGDPASPTLGLADWGERVAANAAALARDLSLGVLGSAEPYSIAILGGLLLLGVVAALRRGPDAIDGFALGYVGLLAIYFTHHSRLVIPLVPIAYRACFEATSLMASFAARGQAGANDAASLSVPSTRRAVAVGTALLASGLLAINLTALPRRLDAESSRLPYGSQGEVWRDLETAASWLATRTEPDARVLAGAAPSLSLLSQRVVYTYRFARKPRLIERYGVRYGVLFPWTPERIAGQLRARATRRTKLPSSARPGRAIELLEFATEKPSG